MLGRQRLHCSPGNRVLLALGLHSGWKVWMKFRCSVSPKGDSRSNPRSSRKSEIQMFKNLAIRVPNHGSRISTALPAVDARQHRFEWVWLGEHEVLSQICTLGGGGIQIKSEGTKAAIYKGRREVGGPTLSKFKTHSGAHPTATPETPFWGRGRERRGEG